MSFVWAKSEVSNMSATLYDTNITLNRAACLPFQDYRYVLLGHDEQLQQIAIKPVSKEDYELNIYPKSQIHKLSLIPTVSLLAKQDMEFFPSFL